MSRQVKGWWAAHGDAFSDRSSSPFHDGTIERRKAAKVEAVPLEGQPHLGLVKRQRQVTVGDKTITRQWEFLIRIECQHLTFSGKADCRFGCEERKQLAIAYANRPV